MKFSFKAKIIKVEERFKNICVSRFGDSAVMKSESAGWYIVLRDNVALGVGFKKPEWKVGDLVKVGNFPL